VVRIQGHGCTPPLTARTLLGTPSGGPYLDPGYQHKGYHRLSPYKRAWFEMTPELKSEKRINPEGRPGRGTAPGTTQPSNKDSGELEGRYGTTTEKARALPDTYCIARNECSCLYLNPGFSPRPTKFLLALLENRIPVGTWRGPTKGPMTKTDSISTYWSTQRAQSFRRITEPCPDPVTGRAVGKEDYSHGNYTTKKKKKKKKKNYLVSTHPRKRRAT